MVWSFGGLSDNALKFVVFILLECELEIFGVDMDKLKGHFIAAEY